MSDTNWYYTANDQTYGPFSIETLQQMVAAGMLSTESQIAKEGDSAWIPFHQAIAGANFQADHASSFHHSKLFTGLAGKVSQASGLEKLDGFSLSHLFSQVFRRHTPEEIEEHFAAGTLHTTPAIANVITKWPTPWAFVRLLGLSLLASIAFYWAIERFGNPILIPGWIFVGCFGIPFAVLVFFVESNILKNVSFYRVMTLLFLGGILSLVVSLFLFEYTMLGDWLGAMSAGVVEEFGKLVAVVLFTRRWINYKWILNGMLFGAAVGTGFSAFESAGYVFVSLAGGEPLGAETTMTLRAFLSPFTHTIWTAATTAALWRVRAGKPFEWSMLFDPRFLRIFTIIAALHMLWNSPMAIPVLGGNTGYLALRLLIGLVGWIVILLLIQAGIKEIRDSQPQDD